VRKCKVKYYDEGTLKECENASFHQWGNGYEEFDEGPGNYTVAIVELPDGRVITPLPENIQFIN